MNVVDRLWAMWTSWSVWKSPVENPCLSTVRSTAKSAGVSLSYGFSTKRTAYYYYCFCNNNIK